MKLVDAFERKLIRAVPLQKGTRYPEKYKDVEWADYNELLESEAQVALVNVSGQFLFKKIPEIENKTISTTTGTSIIYVDRDDYDIKPDSKSKYVNIKLTNKIINHEIINYDEVQTRLVKYNYNDMVVKLIMGDRLTPFQKYAIVCDYRTATTFDTAEVIKYFGKNADTIEIATQGSIRGKILVMQLKNQEEPTALRLFSKMPKELKDIIKEGKLPKLE